MTAEENEMVKVNRLKKVLKWATISILGLVILGSGLTYATLAGMFPASKKLLLIQWIAEWKMSYPESGSHDCTAAWSPPVDGTVPYMLPFYPEVKAAYWALPIGQNREWIPQPIAYRLQGQFPYARYMSFHGYDADKGDYFTSIKDTEILPDSGSANPFLTHTDRNSPNRNYTVWITPEGATLPQTQKHPNVMIMPGPVKGAPFLLRVYRPDEGRNILGGVPLPQVHSFHAQTGEPLKNCSPLKFRVPNKKNRENSLHAKKMKALRKDIRHYRVHSGKSGNYPNQHITYLHTALSTDFGEIAIIKWKVPSTPDTKNGGSRFTHDEDLRYWSMCLGGMNATNSSDCIIDDQARVDDEGYAVLAIGPDDDELRKLAEAKNINYMQWGIHRHPTTILRHMDGEKDFKYAAKHASVFEIDQPPELHGAERTIGVYSPSGYYCSEAKFRKNICGVREYEHPGLLYME